MDDAQQARYNAAFNLIGRTGAGSIQIREVEEDGPPTVYVAVAEYPAGVRGLDPVTRERGVLARTYYAVGAGLHPLRALEALLEEVVDGSECTYCHKPTAWTRDFTDEIAELSRPWFCWRQWDPELKTYRRSCEGDQTKET